MRRHTALLTMTALCTALTLPSLGAAQEAAPTDGAAPAQGLDDRRWYPASGQDLVDLIRDCESGECMSYVSGAISGLSTKAHIFGQEHPFCSGDTVPIRDIRDAIVTAVDGDPELAQAPSTFAIMAAFAAAWPCDENGAQAAPASAAADTIPIEAMTALGEGAVIKLIADTPSALEKGDPAAAILNTITVFHDPNCPHCASFRAETDILADAGWRVRVIPVGIMSTDSQGYSALMAAFAQTRPDAVEALYRAAIPGQATVAAGLKVLEDMGISAPDALAAVSTTGAYDAVGSSNDRLFSLGGKGTPSWVVGDYLAIGGMPAAAIQELATRLPTPPGATDLERPTQTQNDTPVEPLELPDESQEAEEETDAEPATDAAPSAP